MIRILIAEDDEPMRGYLARALHKAGYDIVATGSGDEAAPWLEREHFDLLLSDVIMPGIDGIELGRICERVSPGTKIIFITGFAAISLETSGTGPKPKVLSKPFHLRELVLEIQRLFGPDALAGF